MRSVCNHDQSCFSFWEIFGKENNSWMNMAFFLLTAAHSSILDILYIFWEGQTLAAILTAAYIYYYYTILLGGKKLSQKRVNSISFGVCCVALARPQSLLLVCCVYSFLGWLKTLLSPWTTEPVSFIFLFSLFFGLEKKNERICGETEIYIF